MSLINVTNVIVENPQDLFLASIKLSITFEVLQPIANEIEWRLIYVGSPKDEKYDQVLDQFSMGPLQQGVMQFAMETAPPNVQLIPSKEDLIGVTAIILSVSFMKKEFFRCGYYVYNNYCAPELIENDPPQVLFDQLYRHIYCEKPRVTRYNIAWDNQMVYHAPLMQTDHNFMFSQQQPVLGDLTNCFQQPQYPQQDYKVEGMMQQQQQQQQSFYGQNQPY